MWGQADLAGNAAEWTLDYYNSSYIDPCTDCAYLTEGFGGNNRIYRGGSAAQYIMTMLNNDRVAYDGTEGDASSGVRCARVP